MVWIGYLQWTRDNGFGSRQEPILGAMTNIAEMDTVLSRDGAQDRSFKGPWRERTSDTRASTTDPDATPMTWAGSGRKLGYQAHYVVDGGKARIVLNVLVAPAEVTENRPMLDLLWRTVFRWRLRPHHVTGDVPGEPPSDPPGSAPGARRGPVRVRIRRRARRFQKPPRSPPPRAARGVRGGAGGSGARTKIRGVT